MSLCIGYDVDKGPQLFFSDPSGVFYGDGDMITAVDLYALYYIGTYLEYKGKAIGSGSEGAQITLQVSISCISCVINKDFYSMANSSSIVE